MKTRIPRKLKKKYNMTYKHYNKLILKLINRIGLKEFVNRMYRQYGK